jgi:hypothetical protein
MSKRLPSNFKRNRAATIIALSLGLTSTALYAQEAEEEQSKDEL